MENNPRLNHCWWTLRVAFGLVPIAAGLDKFLNLLTNWEMYLNPLLPKMLHMSASSMMHMAGVIEIIAGVLMFTRLTRYVAYVVMVWLWAISLNLITQGQFLDIAVRDIVMSLGAFVLAKLSEVRDPAAADLSVRSLNPTSDGVRRTA